MSTESAKPIPIERARFDLEMERLRRLREEQPLQRGVDPVTTSPDLVHGVAHAVEIWGTKRIAEALGMGKSTVHEWTVRASRDAARGRMAAAPEPWREDTEVLTIHRCITALDTLDREGRHRVLSYLDERYFGRAKVKP